MHRLFLGFGEEGEDLVREGLGGLVFLFNRDAVSKLSS